MAKRKKKGGGDLTVYKSYTFGGQDPVIERFRTAQQMSNRTVKQISHAGGPSVSTMYNWLNGKTKRPQFCTATAALRGVGGDFLIQLPNGSIVNLNGRVTKI